MVEQENNLWIITLRLTDDAFQKIQTFRTELQGEGSQTTSFQRILISLLDAVLREYRSLVFGLRESTPLLAWSCRNMLELDICTKFVLLKGSSAKDFADDVLIDAYEIFSAFSALVKFYEPTAVTPELDRTIVNVQSEKTRRQITRKHYLRSQDMADAVGFHEEFQYMNKIASKLVHPTAFSVLTAFDEGELRNLKPILFNSGVRYGVEAFTEIKEYVSKKHVEPRP